MRELRELGSIEGQNIRIGYAEGDVARLDEQATEMVRLDVESIVEHLLLRADEVIE